MLVNLHKVSGCPCLFKGPILSTLFTLGSRSAAAHNSFYTKQTKMSAKSDALLDLAGQKQGWKNVEFTHQATTPHDITKGWTIFF